MLVLVAACGADNTDGITFTVQGVPALFDAKIDDGPWQTYMPKRVFEGNAVYNIPTFLSTIDAVFVCEHADGTFDAGETRTTDPADLGTYCDIADREQLVVNIHNAGLQTMVAVYDDENRTGAQTDAQFSFQAPKPKADVVVYDADRFALQRDVDMAHGPNEVTFDLATAPALRIGHYAYDPPDADETLMDYDGFETSNGTMAPFSFVGAGSYKIPDGSLMAPTDYAFADLEAFSSTSSRSIDLINPDPTTTYATHWLPRITGTIDPLLTAATFGPFDFDFDSIGVQCNTKSGREFASVTRGYRDVHDASISFDEDLPGWRWTIGADNRSCGGDLTKRIDPNTIESTGFF